jgi:hypothetical protein
MGKKAAAPPPPPDYKALAIEQAGLDKATLDNQTRANRINQYTTDGSLEYYEDPETGNWSSVESMSPEQQYLHDQDMYQKAALGNVGMGMLGRVQDSVANPFSMQGMTDVKGYDTSQLQQWGGVPGQGLGGYGNLDYSSLGAMPDSGFGAVEGIQKAMMSRLDPGLTRGRENEIARLKAQGFNEGDAGFNTQLQLQDQRRNDAEQQALLGAAGEYGNIFNRGMDVRRQGADEMYKSAQFNKDVRSRQFDEQQQASEYANALRGEQFGEQGILRGASSDDRTRQMNEAMMMRQMPLQELQNFMNGVNGQNPSFETYNQAGRGTAADMMGAADKEYQAQVAATNAKNAAGAAKTAGLMKLAGSVAGSFFGPVGTALGGALGGALAGGGGGTVTGGSGIKLGG